MIKHKQLVHALALCEHGNFHRAAEAVGLSQPAFSRSIRNLEDGLGVVLFDRNTHGVTPTPYCDVLVRRAQTIIEEAEEIQREIAFSKGPNFGALSVAMGVYAAEISGAQVISQMAHDLPNLSLSVNECSWQSVCEQVLNRTIDLGYTNSERVFSDQLEVEIIASHETVFFCRSGHPLTKINAISANDLHQYPVVRIRMKGTNKTTSTGNTSFVCENGNRRRSIELENLTMARAIVANSNAYCLATPIQIENQLRSGEFSVLPYSTSRHNLNYGFITLRERTMSAAALEFMAHARRIEPELVTRNCELKKLYAPLH
jgi:DNA-binding transcriptional LysR family regulator